jgi:hypothetical protein
VKKERQRGASPDSVKTPKWTEEKATLKGTTGMARLHGSVRLKMYRRAFVSINRMRAGHSSLKGSLSRFDTVSTAECECGDGLQTEEHTRMFWDCKLYEDQRAIMMVILSENSNKEYPKSARELLRLEGKRFMQGVLLHEQNSLIYLKKGTEVNVQNINNIIFRVKTYIKKSRSDHYDRIRYKTVPQRSGWALLRPFLYIHF